MKRLQDVAWWLFAEGATAEEIAQRYPSIPLADVYQVIGYGLRHSAELEPYLARRREDIRETGRSNESRWPPDGIRDRLMARAAQAIENWMGGLDRGDRVVTCAIAHGEILFGIARLPAGRRRTELEETGRQFLGCFPLRTGPGASGRLLRGRQAGSPTARPHPGRKRPVGSRDGARPLCDAGQPR